jgi:hypothetical protein
MSNPSALFTERLWVLALNDLEALEIRNLLESHGETVCYSSQPWGATWANLETPILDTLTRLRQHRPAAEIIGVELAGPNRFAAIDIDHHTYSDADRSSPFSSLEQVADRLGVPLTRWQTLVALNDRGYIPAMLAAGASPREVVQIRSLDRAAQGITPADEQAAEADIRQHEEHRGAKVLVRCSNNPTSAHSDRLFGAAEEILLAGPSQWSYSGPRHKALAAMGLPEPHWSGGSPASGYFGIQDPGPATQFRLLNFFWDAAGGTDSESDPPLAPGS